MSEESETLLDTFTRVAKLLAKLPDDATRRRVLAAVICLTDDESAASALWSYKGRSGGEG